MSKTRCIIIEDEPLATKILSTYISRVSTLELKAVFKNAILAMDWLTTNDVDLIFLDIHLPKLRGIDFLKTMKDPPAIIITTAYQQYAVEGFDLNVTDYLLKPFEFKRFLTAVDKVKVAENDSTTPNSEYIFLRSERKTVKVLLSEIVYIESQREYIKIVSTEREYISRMSTKEIENVLPASMFKRIHRSYIISTNKVKSFTSDLVDVNGITLPIGRGYRDVIEKL